VSSFLTAHQHIEGHFSAIYPQRAVYLGRGVGSVRRGGVCVASGIGIKKKIPWEGLPEGEGVVWDSLALYMHIKFEVSSFSRFGDIKGVPKSRSHDPVQDM